jgi:hypothetical protein
MLYSFASPERIRSAYEEAIREKYLWHEFGDSHLILRCMMSDETAWGSTPDAALESLLTGVRSNDFTVAEWGAWLYLLLIKSGKSFLR